MASFFKDKVMPLMRVKVETDFGVSLQSFAKAKSEDIAHEELPHLYKEMDWIISFQDDDYVPHFDDDRYIEEISKQEAIEILYETIKMAKRTIKRASKILFMVIMDDIKNTKKLSKKQKNKTK